MLLKDKVAVIYGAGGAVGSAVPHAFAREGAKLFLIGRHGAPVEGLAREIAATGASAEAKVLDALDGEGIDKHLDAVVAKTGRIDISFNAVGIRNTKLQGVPLVGLDVEEFVRPIDTYARSYFLTSRLAARRMVPKRAGVIMTVTSTPSREGIALMGGVGPAMAAVEQLTRNLSGQSSLRAAFASLACDPPVCRKATRSKRSSRSPRTRGASRGNSSAS